jgi:hypothetical protein
MKFIIAFLLSLLLCSSVVASFEITLGWLGPNGEYPSVVNIGETYDSYLRCDILQGDYSGWLALVEPDGQKTLHPNTQFYENGYYFIWDSWTVGLPDFHTSLAQFQGSLNGSSTKYGPYVAKPITGDVNADGVTNTLDLLQLLDYWGEEQGPIGTPWHDLNNDGVVDAGDLVQLIENWGYPPK